MLALSFTAHVLLCIGSVHAFAPESSFHDCPRWQSTHRLGLAGDDYTTTTWGDDNTSSSCRRDNGHYDDRKNTHQPLSRRTFASQATSTVFTTSLLATLLTPKKATAGIDINSLKTAPIEGDATGAASRVKQLQQPTTKQDGTVYLDSGVSYTESNAGSAPGGRNRAIRNGVQNGFNVGADLRISAPNLEQGAGGLPIYSTRDDNQSNELSWKVGSGDFPKGAEEGMMGMRLGSVRRIEVPSDLVFAARNAGAVPEATTKEGRERYESVMRSGDARLVFDIRVTGINPGDGRI